jgi:hypothetical protein
VLRVVKQFCSSNSQDRNLLVLSSRFARLACLLAWLATQSYGNKTLKKLSNIDLNMGCVCEAFFQHLLKLKILMIMMCDEREGNELREWNWKRKNHWTTSTHSKRCLRFSSFVCSFVGWLVYLFHVICFIISTTAVCLVPLSLSSLSSSCLFQQHKLMSRFEMHHVRFVSWFIYGLQQQQLADWTYFCHSCCCCCNCAREFRGKCEAWNAISASAAR